jgi:hypothetical protein
LEDADERAVVQLDAEQLRALQDVVARVDITRLAASLARRGGLDGTSMSIQVRDGEGRVALAEGPILQRKKGEHDFRDVHGPAQQVWQLVRSFLPLDPDA